MKKILFLFSILLLMACSGKQSNQTVLEVLWFSDGGEGDSFNKLARAYETLNPNIKIELIEVPYNDINNRLRNMMNGKKPPALARLSNLGLFLPQLVNVADYSPQGLDFANNFNEGLQVIYDGKIPAVPMDVTANGLIYNKTAFDLAGVKVPLTEEEIWTWQEWQTAMQQVMARGNVKYGLVFDRSPSRFSTLAYQAGASMLNLELTKSNFNSPQMARAVDFFVNLHKQGIIPTSVWLGAENPNNLFRTGQVAMHFAGSWMVANYQKEITDFEWGVTYLPKDARRSSVAGGKYLAAVQGSGVEAEAVQFMEWISLPENNAQFCIENNYLSQIKGNETLDYPFGTDFFTIFANDLSASPATPGREWGFHRFTSRMEGDMREKLAEVLAGKLTTQGYLNHMEKLINTTLQEITSEQ